MKIKNIIILLFVIINITGCTSCSESCFWGIDLETCENKKFLSKFIDQYKNELSADYIDQIKKCIPDEECDKEIVNVFYNKARVLLKNKKLEKYGLKQSGPMQAPEENKE